MLTVVAAAEPIYANEHETHINLKVVFKEIGPYAILFTASESDTEPHGRALFVDAKAGKFGRVAPYEPATVQPALPVTNAPPTVNSAHR